MAVRHSIKYKIAHSISLLFTKLNMYPGQIRTKSTTKYDQ